MLTSVDFSKIHVTDFQQGKGCKTTCASLEGRDVTFQISPERFLNMPFGASAFDKEKETTRLNLDFDVSCVADIDVLDEWALEYATNEKDRLFPGMSKEDIARDYYKCCQTSEKYGSTRLRTKVSTGGIQKCKCFLHPEKLSAEIKDYDLRQCTARPYIKFLGFWKQGRGWGLCLQTTALLISKAEEDCPF